MPPDGGAPMPVETEVDVDAVTSVSFTNISCKLAAMDKCAAAASTRSLMTFACCRDNGACETDTALEAEMLIGMSLLFRWDDWDVNKEFIIAMAELKAVLVSFVLKAEGFECTALLPTLLPSYHALRMTPPLI
jgi:hypothetical protein